MYAYIDTLHAFPIINTILINSLYFTDQYKVAVGSPLTGAPHQN